MRLKFVSMIFEQKQAIILCIGAFKCRNICNLFVDKIEYNKYFYYL